LKVLKNEKESGATLLVAPLRVCYSVWPGEIAKWKEFNALTYSMLHGPEKEVAARTVSDIYLINPEGLQWLLQTPDILKRLKITNLIIDESSKFKNTQTKRFKLLKPFLKNFTRRWILTGSPAPNGLLDLFGQIYILDLGSALSPYITQYRRLFFDPTGYGGYEWKLKPDGAARIQKAVAPLVMRLEAGDYIDLPKLAFNDVVIDLPEKARRIYDRMEAVLLAEIGGDEVITAANAGVASQKCRQIANGGVYRSGMDVDFPLIDKERWAHLHMEKAEAVADIVEELEGQQVLIGYEFDHDLDRLRQVLPKDFCFVSDYSAMKFKDLERRWNKQDIPGLVGQTSSVSHGLNLQEGSCQHLILHSMTWNWEDYMQFIRRVWRQGNKSKRVTVHNIVARDTIDEIMVKVVPAKGRVEYNFLTALKSLAQKRRK
jgi:SNF2 family DNA or RNA helicase